MGFPHRPVPVREVRGVDMAEMIKPGDVVGAGYGVIAVHVQQDGSGAVLAHRTMLHHPAGGEYAVWTLHRDGDLTNGAFPERHDRARELYGQRIADRLADLWEPSPTIGGAL